MIRGLITDEVVVLIEPGWLEVRSLYREKQYAGAPKLSVSAREALIHSGANFDLKAVASDPSRIATVEPFSHPRVVVTDAEFAGRLLRAFLRELYGRNHLLPSINMFIYPPAARRKDLTFVEAEALREAARVAGAKGFVVTIDKIFTAADLKEMKQVRFEKAVEDHLKGET
jgi:hypothetical protein